MDSQNLVLMDGIIDIIIAVVAKVIFERDLSCSLNLQESKNFSSNFSKAKTGYW
jgi:hypothetical protein